MLKSGLPIPSDACGARKRLRVPVATKRAHSDSPVTARTGDIQKKPLSFANRRCQSLSPSTQTCKRLDDRVSFTQDNSLEPRVAESHNFTQVTPEQELTMPHSLMIKTTRIFNTKKREFVKLRKSVIQQQNTLLEQYASLKELEARVGGPADEALGEVRVVSLSNWPAHDLLLLIRDDLDLPLHSEISGTFGPQVLQQLHAQLNPVPEEVLSMGAEIMARRIDMLNLLRGKHRNDRVNYLTSLEWKAKNTEFDHETEHLRKLVAGTAENLKAKINYTFELAKIPWLDREAMTKKLERLQKDNMIFQHKIEEVQKKETVDCKDAKQCADGNNPNYSAVCEELAKEKLAREALKGVVSSAESMLRVARSRIASLERKVKDTKADLEAARRKHKDLEQLVKRLEHTHYTYRHRETSYDARSKKLLEVSKTGEITIEALSRQRDALELRVKELHEQAETAEKTAELREYEQRSRAESLQAKVAEQEKRKELAEVRATELELRVKELEEILLNLRERSGQLVEMERRRCLEYVPSKENEPSDRETEIWKELQVTRLALSRAEEELRLSRADKDSLLNSLSRIAQDGAENIQDKMATELLDREKKIVKLQHILEEQRENENLMEQSMTQYENKLAALRLEVKRLRNYECYSKEIPYQELHTELLELHMQVETLTRERSALVTAAASRALMLERHERAADLFAKVTRARRDLAALLDGRTDPPPMDDITHAEVSRSLSSVCATSADTWTALRGERARVLRLERAVLAQSLQLEREGRVRTQLERRRALLERDILRARTASSSDASRVLAVNNTSLIQDIFCYR